MIHLPWFDAALLSASFYLLGILSVLIARAERYLRRSRVYVWSEQEDVFGWEGLEDPGNRKEEV